VVRGRKRKKCGFKRETDFFNKVRDILDPECELFAEDIVERALKNIVLWEKHKERGRNQMRKIRSQNRKIKKSLNPDSN
jgi:predicted Rdx family selenoprotein